MVTNQTSRHQSTNGSNCLQSISIKSKAKREVFLFSFCFTTITELFLIGMSQIDIVCSCSVHTTILLGVLIIILWSWIGFLLFLIHKNSHNTMTVTYFSPLPALPSQAILSIPQSSMVSNRRSVTRFILSLSIYAYMNYLSYTINLLKGF